MSTHMQRPGATALEPSDATSASGFRTSVTDVEARRLTGRFASDGPGGRRTPMRLLTSPARQAHAGLRQLSAHLSAGDGFLVAARALGLGLPRQVAGLVPARRQLAHLHRAVLRVDAAATTRVPGYDVRTRIAPVAVVHRHGVWIMPLIGGSTEGSTRGAFATSAARPSAQPCETRMAMRLHWARLDSNQGPTDYESAALTS